ncbi:MAG: 50S ribosomal protein L13 [Bacteroidaceae bacterium]|nr:50S ribosomal protein L13 [Prevotellaceae bacterium]MDY5631601.1 50S ribosomal protein L13 [Bacteroidaceae bacterium]
METLSFKTISANKQTVNKEWVVVDATDQVLGRLASKVAKILRGKYKPNFTPHVDCGDNVVIVNADKIILTGNKMSDKVYLRYTGYPGGQRSETPASIIAKKNGYEKLIRRTVKGMLPKTKLADRIIMNLYVYEGAEHKHEAQSPKAIDINLYK